ncbi:carbohydrate ABC transporter permease [Paenibacillus sacheonensis]|uniref:ABC transporter permease subunit n=1 Tax=Paenibacillus sacheonensis TaxID=742054 RepID=A0A7X5BZ00_9BACL|nr:carbohydrate ABC transporter permease [Paenibacillus sacheonensis]MBM7565028.1 putative aldouronate transport system permease protein [Paenibacillus sacheonensis]NBC70187.1 ABC transporter permease subunit [Paenibacillus sacheonensis]
MSTTTVKAPAAAAAVSRPAAKRINSISPTSNLIVNLFFFIYSCACLLPVILVISASLSDENAITLHGYSLIPRVWSTAAYHYLTFDMHKILTGYGISIATTVIGSLIGMMITALYAYPLSRMDFGFRSFFSFFIFFTMIFGGGLVPSYLVYTNLFHIKDTLFALIVPGLLMNAFLVLTTRTFFQQTIHPSILESAQIDGASEFRIFFGIVLPLSLPVMATIGLFYTLSYWNDWFNSLVYISNDDMVNLQYMMYRVMRNLQFLQSNAQSSSAIGAAEIAKIPNETVRMAMCIIGMGPIVLAYPFFQRYFVAGLTVGAVKG